MKHSMSLILLFGVLALSSYKDGQAQTGSQRSSGTMTAPGNTKNQENPEPSDKKDANDHSRSRKNTDSAGTKGTHHTTKNRAKAVDTRAKGRDSSGMGSESGTGGIPR